MDFVDRQSPRVAEPPGGQSPDNASSRTLHEPKNQKVFGMRVFDPGSIATYSVHAAQDPGQLESKAKSEISILSASGMTND